MSRGFTLWLTGLPGSGKTTLGGVLKNRLESRGLTVEVLDGDEVRKNLSPDLGFTKREREIHAKRVAYVSKLLTRNGTVTIVALISPFRSFREHARHEIGDFIEVYVKCSVEICSKRDPKGLYRRAQLGEIKDLTGVQDSYEEPLRPEVVVDTEKLGPEEGAEKILVKLEELGYLK